jgi:cytochrome c-type biogenesis protein CcmH/NrfG
MESNSFLPKMTGVNEPDRISIGLFKVAQYLLLGVFALMPLFFIPGVPALISTGKIYFVLLGLVLVLITSSLAILRSGILTFRVSPLLYAWWGVVAASFISAILAPQAMVALVGDALEIHTVGFLALLGMVMTVCQLFVSRQQSIVYLYAAFFASALVLAVLHLLRVIFGADVLALGYLMSPASTLIGSFNDLGLYLVLTILITLIALVQLSLPKLAQIVLATLTTLSLVLLAVVSFYALWLVLALFSLLLLMYVLTKGRFGANRGQTQMTSLSLTAISVIALVFVTSTVFLIGGTGLGGAVSQMTGISYIEVRPSVGATVDILRNVYSEQAFTGAGPNHFNEAWNLYKDQSLNETVFWDTAFNAGSGYIPTWFVTAGIFGVATWLIFLGMFVFTGAQALLRTTSNDNFWYFIATISFVSGLFVWLASLVYVPGPTILILGALSAGILIIANQALIPRQFPTYNLLTTARTGFLLITIVMVVIISSIAVGYGAFRQFAGAYTFAVASSQPLTPETIDSITSQLARAYNYHQSDAYARTLARYQLAHINYLANIPEPSAEDRQRFEAQIGNGLEVASVATARRPEDPRNWLILGDVYATLAAIPVPNAADRAKEAYQEAQKRDPKNPYYAFQFAALAIQAQDTDEARRQIQNALTLKTNYVDAIFLLSQLDVAAGNFPEAIAATRALISLEPNNAGRYYQLGVLESAASNRAGAIDAFSAAITINPSFANARYLRALEYFADGKVADAVSELKQVRDLSPDNAGLATLIDQIERREITPESVRAEAAVTAPVAEPETVGTDNEVTTTNVVPDSDLVTPVNASEPATGDDAAATAEERETTPAVTE